MARVLGRSRPTLMVPLDDALISGPSSFHGGPPDVLAQLACDVGVDSILGFPGLIARLPSDAAVGRVVNLTASTTRQAHADKVIAGTVEDALAVGADAVAVHVNISADTEREMIQTLAAVSSRAGQLGVPVVAIVYPRRTSSDGTDDNYDDLAQEDARAYADLIAHGARVAVEMGSSIVKTKYPGSVELTALVARACDGLPLLVAGGPLVPANEYFPVVAAALHGGAAGVSVGRNFFQNGDPASFLRTLRDFLGRQQLSPIEESRA